MGPFPPPPVKRCSSATVGFASAASCAFIRGDITATLSTAQTVATALAATMPATSTANTDRTAFGDGAPLRVRTAATIVHAVVASISARIGIAQSSR